jgi:hypothetical protein
VVTDERLSNVELALAGEQELVPVPVEYAEQMLADAEEEAELADFEDAIECSSGPPRANHAES